MASSWTLEGYEIYDAIGQGSYAQVFRGLHKPSNTIVAIKKIITENIQKAAALTSSEEFVLMKELKPHRNIVKLVDVKIFSEYACIVLEYAGPDNILTLVNKHEKLPEGKSARIFAKLLDGLEFLHQTGIVHRDVKAENVLLRGDSDDPVLCDFGFATKWSPTTKLTKYCGSLLYASPEIVSRTPYVGPEVDIWSLGVLLYGMVAGFLPFYGNRQKVVSAIQRADFEFPMDFSDDICYFIELMLEPNSKQRALPQELRTHIWFKNHTGMLQPPEPTADLLVQSIRDSRNILNFSLTASGRSLRKSTKTILRQSGLESSKRCADFATLQEELHDDIQRAQDELQPLPEVEEKQNPTSLYSNQKKISIPILLEDLQQRDQDDDKPEEKPTTKDDTHLQTQQHSYQVGRSISTPQQSTTAPTIDGSASPRGAKSFISGIMKAISPRGATSPNAPRKDSSAGKN